MASSEAKAHSPEDLSNLKRRLENYRELIVPLKKVLEWEQKYYPAVLIGVLTVIFSLVWYGEPSVLTSVCTLGIIVSVLDYALPQIISRFMRQVEWTANDDRQFDAVCERLLNARQHCDDVKKWLAHLRETKPAQFLALMSLLFAVLAWFGSLIDNLLLLYLLVVCATLIPGLRKHGVLQAVTDKLKKTISKPKTN